MVQLKFLRNFEPKGENESLLVSEPWDLPNSNNDGFANLGFNELLNLTVSILGGCGGLEITYF